MHGTDYDATKTHAALYLYDKQLCSLGNTTFSLENVGQDSLEIERRLLGRLRAMKQFSTILSNVLSSRSIDYALRVRFTGAVVPREDWWVPLGWAEAGL